MLTLDHVVVHHRYLGHRSANVDESKHQEIEKHFTPRRRREIGLVGRMDSGFMVQ